ncbi:helix-turn-helix domain-containing protein [Arthrobacter sp. IK3]|uniref:helix-turn-helix domain-containing protein n=1 Tax=Arthrobacter sp. IK3 TaxID=3448169 RepID=UPI003EE0B08F
MTYEERLAAAIIVQLRVEMAARDWNQQVLSERLNIFPATLNRYLKGHRQVPMVTFIQMARVFGMKAAELLGAAEDRMEPANPETAAAG